jgi:hypothetical protein
LTEDRIGMRTTLTILRGSKRFDLIVTPEVRKQ